MDLLHFGDFEGCAVAIYPRESELSSSILFFLSFSKIGPKSSFWIQRWSGFTGPLPTCPIPTALARGIG